MMEPADLLYQADAARRLTLSDREAGERAFHELLCAMPDASVVFYKRGEAYEALGEIALAAADYHQAASLPDADLWVVRAADALERLLP
jgi:tetratricopeptide (TPR) repeat protein